MGKRSRVDHICKWGGIRSAIQGTTNRSRRFGPVGAVSAILWRHTTDWIISHKQVCPAVLSPIVNVVIWRRWWNARTEQRSGLTNFQQIQCSKLMQKVTISTCHSAKGLEFPVVIIPSGNLFVRIEKSSLLMDVIVDQNTFPFYRTEDIDEERFISFRNIRSKLTSVILQAPFIRCMYSSPMFIVPPLFGEKASRGTDKRQVPFRLHLYTTGEGHGTVLPLISVLTLTTAPGTVQLQYASLSSHWPRSDLSSSQTKAPRRIGNWTKARGVVSIFVSHFGHRNIDVSFRELSGDHVQPTHQNPGGGMATISLKGAKSSIVNVPVGGGMLHPVTSVYLST